MLPILYPPGSDPANFPPGAGPAPDPMVLLNFLWSGVEFLAKAMFGM